MDPFRPSQNARQDSEFVFETVELHDTGSTSDHWLLSFVDTDMPSRPVELTPDGWQEVPALHLGVRRRGSRRTA